MKQYITVVASDAGKVIKYQDFDTQAEAEAHVLLYGGFVAPNPGGLITHWIVSGETLTHDSAGQVAAELERGWADVRMKRDKLLVDSDFSQLDDSPKDKVAWKTYRQALRDITNVATPDLVVWPSEPV